MPGTIDNAVKEAKETAIPQLREVSKLIREKLDRPFPNAQSYEDFEGIKRMDIIPLGLTLDLIRKELREIIKEFDAQSKTIKDILRTEP